jgi:hypothetical protein
MQSPQIRGVDHFPSIQAKIGVLQRGQIHDFLTIASAFIFSLMLVYFGWGFCGLVFVPSASGKSNQSPQKFHC